MKKSRGENNHSNFIREFVTDPGNVPDVMCLYGYLGPSTEPGHERLYQTPSLTPYIEIPANAILHRRRAAPEQDPLDGVTLWVRRDAKLIHKMTPTARAQASYFAGALHAGAGSPGVYFARRWNTHGVCAQATVQDCPTRDDFTQDQCLWRPHTGPLCQSTAQDCGTHNYTQDACGT